jgi:DNA repair protein RecN (Recombination protein N)
MLMELRIRDFAVIDELSLHLKPGLNALSGETGAGKSIIVGALSLLVGERASTQVVRTGAKRAMVEGVFDVQRIPELQEKLAEMGIPLEDDLLILRREVASEGRNRSWINGSPATATALGELGAMLVDIHGQHEHQSLLRPPEQRKILDIFLGIEDLALAVKRLYQQTNEKQKALDGKKARLRELEARGDFLRFQAQEIREAGLSVGEEEALEEEARRLTHAQELAEGARTLHEGLYGRDDALSDQVAAFRDLLARLTEMDPVLGPASEYLAEAYHFLADTGQRMGSYAAGIEDDPIRLEEIRRRQDLIFRMKRKYGPEIRDVLETGEKVTAELEELESADLDLREEEEELERFAQEFAGRTSELTLRRREGAERLAARILQVLPHLGLAKTEFIVQVSPLEKPGPSGSDGVEFLASLNPGFDAGSLSKIASGGELSRVMLALKSVLAEADRVPTLVFDEIDTGIGGAVANKVAEKLRGVAEHHQVFVITHLPQLAAKAHHQLFVMKDETAGLASTQVQELTGEERISEVARMLGGNPNSPTSRDHARELLTTL